jgi:hypothetical protein
MMSKAYKTIVPQENTESVAPSLMNSMLRRTSQYNHKHIEQVTAAVVL